MQVFFASVRLPVQYIKERPINQDDFCRVFFVTFPRDVKWSEVFFSLFFGTFLFCWALKPRANGRNIVGCYMLRPFAYPVECCWMLLRVVARSLKPVKLFSQQLPTFLLFHDRRSVAQQVGSVRTALPTLLEPCTLITHGLQRLRGCILSTMHC